MSPLRLIERCPDALLTLEYVAESAVRVWQRKRFHARLKRQAAASTGPRFACLLGQQWFNDFLLRKLHQHGFQCSVPATEYFPSWTPNYPLYPAGMLPLSDEAPDFILVDNMFYVNRRRALGDEAMAAGLRKLSRNGAIPVIAIDHCDTILPKFSPRDIDQFDLVLMGKACPKIAS